MKDFVMFWLSTGANLALAEPFIEQCAKDIDILFASFYDEENGYTVYAQRLLQNSRLRLNIDESSNISNFSAQFLGQNFRWETLGFFFCAVCRATIDLPFFPLLYANDSNRIALRRLSTKLIDIALSNVLSLDGLNDLQLILQFESFIVHSHVDGVHSHHSWSRLGDVISSMFALGYHDNIEKTKPRIPHFLTEIRKAAYATVYSADKNVAIFLGRPPRMSKRFTHFQLPLNQTSPGPSPIPYLNGDVIQWNQDTPCSYRAELRWSALCASLKEDILELLRTRNSETYSERASVIQRNAEAQWNALPPHFKLQCNLKACAGTPFERDFLAGTRLNHLHVLFLLRLLFLDTVAEPDVAIIDISEQMLSLVVDTMLLRDQLVNSGTGLVWKVAHYGLPAAGMILLSMLKQQSSQTTGKHFMPKALLDLGIFAAQVQAGSIVRPGDPTYALIYKATQTIEKFLDSMHREAAQPPTEVTSQMEGNDDWAALFDQDVFDFETAFWQNLAGHPLFMVPEDPMSD
ncbi:Transcription factor, fungi [Penicillium expansum]|nr:Transcription factor, fungi [Penicillium expansum]